MRISQPIISALAAALMLAAPVAHAEESLPFSLQVDQFLKVNADRTSMLFDAPAATHAHASQAVIATGIKYNETLDPHRGESSPVALPLYGNWCGPGFSGPGAPIDAIDEACMRHDLCYEHMGYFDELCDSILTERVSRITPQNERQRMTIFGIKAIFNGVHRK
ncbi:MAG: phospholipase A2 family protein [Corynebacterium sp.]|nr:phospholipase A2 family protein [Corynebacterium sp.]